MEVKPINEALSFMGMDATMVEDDPPNVMAPPCKKPRMADAIGLELENQNRVVPMQSVTKNKFSLRCIFCLNPTAKFII